MERKSFLKTLLSWVLTFYGLQAGFQAAVGQDENRDILAFHCTREGISFYQDKNICYCVRLLAARCRPNVQTQAPPLAYTAGDDSSTSTIQATSGTHPLDPLTSDEILKTSHIITRTVPAVALGRLRFNEITLKEPAKSLLRPYFLNNKVPRYLGRKSFTILVDKNSGGVYEVVVDLDEGVVESLREGLRNSHPLATIDSAIKLSSIVAADPQVQERCRKLGYNDMSLVVPEALPLQNLGEYDKYWNLSRPFQVFMYGRKFHGDNHYAHPFDFLVVVDETANAIAGIEDLPTHDYNDLGSNKNGNRIPETSANYDNPRQLRSSNFMRGEDKPINIVMPEGPNYKVTGHDIEWQKFKLRIGFNPREGLVLHNVGYVDNAVFRPIIYRASLSEVATYYADPRAPFNRKYAFDEGGIGFGFATSSLKDQEDCLGETKFFDVTLNNGTGHPTTVKNAICVYEDDAGILWKHAPNKYQDHGNVVVRSHRLNILTSANFGNYDYIIKWSFYQDASIRFQVQLTGIVSTNLVAVGEKGAGVGTIVAPQITAQYHQHIFALRLDFDVDGSENSVHMSEAVPLDDSSNSLGQGFTMRATDLRTQSEGCTRINPFNGRTWIVKNPHRINPHTKGPVGWKVMPVVDPQIMMKRNSPIYSQLRFLEYDMWVTKYEEDQLFAGGFYLNKSGLPEWVRSNPTTSIQNTDLVLWHMFSPVHIPRVEDYPVMPVEGRELWIKPYNFFDQNPALDVPPPSVRNARRRFTKSIQK